MIQAMDEKLAQQNSIVAQRQLTTGGIQEHLDAFGLEAEFGTYGKIVGLSGGQKVKVVMGSAMWNCPHLLVLDEPTNYLDRESLGAMAAAIKIYKVWLSVCARGGVGVWRRAWAQALPSS